MAAKVRRPDEREIEGQRALLESAREAAIRELGYALEPDEESTGIHEIRALRNRLALEKLAKE